MSKGFIFGLGFGILGTVGGFAAGYYISKNKYLAYADKEIASIKNLYENYFEKKSENSNEKNVSSENKEEEKKYTDYTKPYSNSGDTDGDESSVEHKPKKYIKTYCIDGINAGEIAGYKIVTLIYYKDGVLTDDDNNVIQNRKELLGTNLDINNFDETGSLYIRNEDLITDFEILLSDRLYSENNQ